MGSRAKELKRTHNIAFANYLNQRMSKRYEENEGVKLTTGELRDTKNVMITPKEGLSLDKEMLEKSFSLGDDGDQIYSRYKNVKSIFTDKESECGDTITVNEQPDFYELMDEGLGLR